MTHIKYILVIVFFFFTLQYTCKAQVFNDCIIDPNVKTVQLYTNTNQLSPPVIILNSTDFLTIEFDILYNSIIDLQYTIFLCDKNWYKSELLPNEYIQTIGLLEFESGEHSINTSIPYIHYKTSFPNNSIQFLLSGNYIIQVFDEHTKQILLQKRFQVVEPLVSIQALQRRPNTVDLMDTHQAVDINISWENIPIVNQINQLQVLVQQNNRWDNCKWYTKPTHIYMQSIKFTTEPYNCFYGNAEFRQFNFKNMRFAGQYIRRIDWENGIYKIYLEPNEFQAFKPYANTKDLNGKFLPSHEISATDASTVADYAYVHFTIQYTKQIYDTLDIYVVGGFNSWSITDENKMIYNNQTNMYEAAILLKQGYYDYSLAFVSHDKKHIFTHEIEGSYNKTENRYDIFVYYYDISKGYDRIIGYQTIEQTK
jgi:hypothetical protein